MTTSRPYRDAGLAYLRLDDAEIVARLLADPRLLRLPLVRHGNDGDGRPSAEATSGRRWRSGRGRALSAVARRGPTPRRTSERRPERPPSAASSIMNARSPGGAPDPGRSRRVRPARAAAAMIQRDRAPAPPRWHPSPDDRYDAQPRSPPGPAAIRVTPKAAEKLGRRRRRDRGREAPRSGRPDPPSSTPTRGGRCGSWPSSSRASTRWPTVGPAVTVFGSARTRPDGTRSTSWPATIGRKLAEAATR